MWDIFRLCFSLFPHIILARHAILMVYACVRKRVRSVSLSAASGGRASTFHVAGWPSPSSWWMWTGQASCFADDGNSQPSNGNRLWNSHGHPRFRLASGPLLILIVQRCPTHEFLLYIYIYIYVSLMIGQIQWPYTDSLDIACFSSCRWHLSIWKCGCTIHALVLFGGVLFAVSWRYLLASYSNKSRTARCFATRNSISCSSKVRSEHISWTRRPCLEHTVTWQGASHPLQLIPWGSASCTQELLCVFEAVAAWQNFEGKVPVA